MNKRATKRGAKKAKRSGFPAGRYSGIAAKACKACKVRHRLFRRTKKAHCPKR